MITRHRLPLFFTCSMIIFVLLMSLPAGASEGTISVTYRGLGSYYIGDTIILEGYNSFSNQTLIRLSGPGLPAEGVPIFDLDAEAGSASIVPGITGNSWKFAWYTDMVKGIGKLYSGRYTITVFDKIYPDKSATITIYLKKPDFYFDVVPDTIYAGGYVQLTGMAEKGNAVVQFETTDAQGTLYRTDELIVSPSGYFNKGFHLDLPPGVYTITMSSPVVQTKFKRSMTIESTTTDTTSSSVPAADPGTAAPDLLTPVTTMPVYLGNGSVRVTSNPLGATVFLDTVMIGPSPQDLDSIPAGNHLIEVKAPGYVTYSETVMVTADENVQVSPELAKAAPPMPLSLTAVFASLFIVCALYLALFRQKIS